MVLIVSQAAPAMVSVIDPGAGNTCPSKVNGNSLAQTERLTVEVSSGSSATVMVLIVSQATPAMVSVIDPGAGNTCPSKVNGNSLAQTERLTVEVSRGSSASVLVLIESQATRVMESVIDPGAGNTWPSNVYLNSSAPTERLTVEVSSGSSATVMVLIVSQATPAMVSVIDPGAGNTCPSKVNGNSLAQTERLTVEVSSGSSATVMVLIVSQATPAMVSVIDPGAGNTCPSKVNGNSLAQTERLTVEVSSGSSATVMVLIVSQATPAMVSVIDPGAGNTCPSKVNGNSLAQTERLTVDVSSGSSAIVMVLIVSQATPAMVSVIDPGAGNTCPSKVNGNSLAQTERLTVEVSSDRSATVMVLIVSQATPAMVSVIDPGAGNTCPSKVNGNSLAQTERLTVEVSSGSSATVMVLIVSQATPAIVSVMEPGAGNTCPSKVNGNSLAQTERLTVEVSSGSSATVMVLIVSQPIEAATVSVMEPGAGNTCPSKVNGNSLAQTERLTVEVSSGSSATVMVLIVSQATPAMVSVIDPGAGNTCPSKVNGNSLAQT